MGQLLARGFQREELEKTLEKINFRLVNILPREDGRPLQLIFATKDGLALIYFVFDHRIDAIYAVVIGENQSMVFKELRTSLPILEEPEILAMAQNPSKKERIRGLCYLGVIGGEQAREPILSIINEAFILDTDQEIRDAANFAVEALGWPELDQGSDPDLELITEPEPVSDTSSPQLPLRPRLSSNVAARRHMTNGAEHVILYNWTAKIMLKIDIDTWQMLILADGSRDLEALCLAMSNQGIYKGKADLIQQLDKLVRLGLLEDGLEILTECEEDSSATPAERPLDPLPSFTIVCDCRGTCCKSFGSIFFSAKEAKQATILAESMELPIPLNQAFTPFYGAQPKNDEPCAVTHIDGHCLFLAEDGLCELHRKAGPLAKPQTCRIFPRTFVDDGESVRIAPRPECACVMAGIDRADGEALIPEGATVLRDFSPLEPIQIPEDIQLSRTRTAPRRELVSFSRLICEFLLNDAVEIDAPCLAWRLADQIEQTDLSLEGLRMALDDRRPLQASIVKPWLKALYKQAVEATKDGFQSPVDINYLTANWIAAALKNLEPDGIELLLKTPIDQETAKIERFYLRTLAHCHNLSPIGTDMPQGLRDKTIRMLTARAMARANKTFEDPCMRYPLAVLETAIRNLGLACYCANPALNK